MALPTHPRGHAAAPWFLQGLSFALRNRTGQVQVLLLVPRIVRETFRRDALRNARITLDVPDTVARDLRDQAEGECDVYALVKVPRAALERSSSPVVLPGEQR